MLNNQSLRSVPDSVSRCVERVLIPDHGKDISSLDRKDAEIKADITHALWKDNVLRVLGYREIDVRVKDGVVNFTGYITNSSSQSRIKNAIRSIPGIVEVRNHLILDDKLTLDIAAALGVLEGTYHCKFFTGVNYGVASIGGTVKDWKIRALAEKCASENPNTRGVINHIKVSGSEPRLRELPFLQPAIEEPIYFLDWVFGVVKKVVINPNNRRVIAMLVRGKFPEPPNEAKPRVEGDPPIQERFIVIPMETVRHLTRVSGFLNIKSRERNRYSAFDPGLFTIPPIEWTPPYPYCPSDVLFLVENHEKDI
ncbi:MAG: BON domain-containing protein [Anaerolineales bacterium]|nr:BON domain-containing protein [Anaerolineales bacterium]